MFKKTKRKVKPRLELSDEEKLVTDKIELSNEFADSLKKRKHKRSKKIRKYVIKPFKIVSVVLALAILGIIFSVAFSGFGTYVKYAHEFNKIRPQSNSTQLVIYDKDGQEIFRGYGAAEPGRIKLANVPEVVKEATLAAEDLNYYKHGALDYKSLARAVYVNWNESEKNGWQKFSDLARAETYTQGGSTITQQLVKNIYLTPERTFERKVKEVVFSYQLEGKYTKDEILEMYLNEIYYGEQALGIKNAAKVYFNKDVSELSLAEASMLAGLPQAPSEYSPLGDNFYASKKRQEYVLQQMLAANYITLDEAKEAANADLDFYGQTETVDKYPYFSQYVKEELQKQLGTNNIENKGYRVYTSLDQKTQEIAEREAKSGIKELSYRGATNTAIVVADPKTNEILAMVGGVDWEKSKVNVTTAERQPGSSFKPIVYATALENNYTAATILNDKYVNFGGNPPYIPRNYSGGYSGYVTVRNALARSLNVPAVEMGKLVGIDKVIDMAHNLGITTINNDPNSYGLPLALGAGEVKLVDMVEVYSTFAASGTRSPQKAIIKVLDGKGDQLIQPKKKKQQVISKETAYIISSILSDNTARSATFGSYGPLRTDKTTAVKTGTTDNYADSWTVGYSPDYVVGVWMGNNDRTPMRRVSGIEGAAYIWHDIITELLKDKENKAFDKPTEIKEAWINPYNGTLSRYQWRPNILEYFKAGTEPKERVDLGYLRQF